MLTSVNLMSYVEYDGVFHIDGTHGVVKNRFPLDVFAVTDMHGTLHPIAFMLQTTLRITNNLGPGLLFAIESVRYIECYMLYVYGC